ncbi:MAG: hypothetical protein HY323_19585 [Betaproteobacteria bacterium]|nr:hypothetical protein [Betaproteobacteria bacterium]
MIATDAFTTFGRRMASTQGWPYIVIAETPNPIRQLGADALCERAEAMIITIVDGLTLPAAEIERRLKDVSEQQTDRHNTLRSEGAGLKVSSVTPDPVHHEADSPVQLLTRVYDHAYNHGWTDGLPIIPATPELAQKFIAASGRAADTLISVLPPRKGHATVGVIAVNAIMAGCRPEYMPVIIAAVEGLSDPAFPLELMQVTTNPMTPFLLVNGPVRKKLDINCGTGCLGPGWRANATIGRAIRLILNNVGGALPGVYSKASFASPLRYSYICGENEEENPWTPFHVDRGVKREDSTVTVFKASNFCNISGGEGVGPEEILRQIATNMPPMYGGRDGALLLLGVNHAWSLHKTGLTKRDIQQRLWELARLPASHFAESFAARESAAGRGDAETVWRARSPDQIYIAVAGGPGPQDVYIAAEAPQTRVIREI